MKRISWGGFTAAGVLVVAVLGGAVGGAVALSGQEPAPAAPTQQVQTVADEATAEPAAAEEPTQVAEPALAKTVEAPVKAPAPAPRVVERAEVSEPAATVDDVARDETTSTPPKAGGGAVVVTPSAAPVADPKPNPDLPTTTELEPAELEDGRTVYNRKGQKLPANVPPLAVR